MHCPFIYSRWVVGQLVGQPLIYDSKKAPDGWHEILVDSQQSIISTGNTGLLQNPPLPPPSHRLRFVLSHSPVPVPAVSQNPRFANLPLGTRVEYSRASVQIMRKIGQLISNGAEVVTDADQPNANTSAGGMALLVDYGADHLFSNSLRVRFFMMNIESFLQVSRVFEATRLWTHSANLATLT